MRWKNGFKNFHLLFFTISIIFILGCARAPEEEIQETRRALHNTLLSGDEEYAPAVLKEAQDILIKAQAEIEKKNYKIAKKLAIKAKEKAEEAKKMAIDAKNKRR